MAADTLKSSFVFVKKRKAITGNVLCGVATSLNCQCRYFEKRDGTLITENTFFFVFPVDNYNRGAISMGK